MKEELVNKISKKYKLKEEIAYSLVDDIERKGKLQELYDHLGLLETISDLLLEFYENYFN